MTAVYRRFGCKTAANKPLDGPVQEARDQLPPLRAFLIEMDLVSIPGTETTLAEESPPYNPFVTVESEFEAE